MNPSRRNNCLSNGSNQVDFRTVDWRYRLMGETLQLPLAQARNPDIRTATPQERRQQLITVIDSALAIVDAEDNSGATGHIDASLSSRNAKKQ